MALLKDQESDGQKGGDGDDGDGLVDDGLVDGGDEAEGLMLDMKVIQSLISRDRKNSTTRSIMRLLMKLI